MFPIAIKPECLGEYAAACDIDAVEKAFNQVAGFIEEPPVMAFAASAGEGMVDQTNLVGTGVGLKDSKGETTGAVCVKVFVRNKVPPEQIDASAAIPAEIGGVPTDVEEVGDVEAFVGFRQRQRPVPAGVSTGNCEQVMAGTLGCYVTRRDALHLLSNNHVLALVNTAPLGSHTPQPGRLDGGMCAQDDVGVLSNFIHLDTNGNANRVDAAIAKVDDPKAVDLRMIRPNGGRESLKDPHVTPAIGTKVQKSGRTTGYTTGVIDAVQIRISVGYGRQGVGLFVDQFRVRGDDNRAFSDRGDSGSLITTLPDNQPVGLLFAGNALANQTFANPIETVLSELNLQIAYG